MLKSLKELIISVSKFLKLVRGVLGFAKAEKIKPWF